MKTSDKLKLPFGVDQCWELDAKDSVTSLLQPNAEPLDDVASAVSKALEKPIEQSDVARVKRSRKSGHLLPGQLPLK